MDKEKKVQWDSSDNPNQVWEIRAGHIRGSATFHIVESTFLMVAPHRMTAGEVVQSFLDARGPKCYYIIKDLKLLGEIRCVIPLDK